MRNCFYYELYTMAYPTIELVEALRETAGRLRNGSSYAWGDHGSCNCGNLLQVITKLGKEEILRHAHSGVGEWTELAADYCGITQAPVDLMISHLQKLGLTTSDIHNLEYLEDKNVLKNLPGGFRWLKKNIRKDVIIYFETFATILEEKLIHSVHIDYNLLTAKKKEELLAY
ncbi:MAG: hypothetical protein JWM28_1570 [Chitinophagaceae bacterium]|nr:hypothetical protein [Chitinophagaceae bacterium]